MNLVMIYLEGLERSYLDVPGLMPKLSRWREQTIRFSNVYQVTPGSTMVGIVATQCGWPIFRVRRPSDEDDPSFLGGLRCLGDELSDAGYESVYMGGADNRFTAKRLFFTTHGFETVLGGPELEERLPDPEYQNDWGLHDDSLFEMAWTELERLSRHDAPFALVLLTLGTHVPGFIADSCPEYAESNQQMLRAVHCTDKLVYDFVQRIRNSAVSDETAIVVLSDHLMPGSHMHGVKLGKRTLALLLDIPGEKARHMEQKGTHFDVAPTILAALGFQLSGRIGLGSSLMLHEGYLWSSELGFRNELALRKFVKSREIRDYMDAQW
jgi:phosphoglycerol transferase